MRFRLITRESIEAPILMGGVAVRDVEHARSLGADAYADDGAEAVAWAQRLVTA